MDGDTHKVILDTVTTFTGEYERIICQSDGCHSDCRVRQKWMHGELEYQWLDVKSRFEKKHPSPENGKAEVAE